MNLECFPVTWSQDIEVKCQKHKNQKIVFVCISHEGCSFTNLLCMECFDDLPTNHPHHLISLKKFNQLYQSYNAQRTQNTQDFHQTLQMFSFQLRNQIDIVQNSTIALLHNLLKNDIESYGLLKFREHLARSAQRNIWEKIHSLQSAKKLLDEQIEHQIQSCVSPVHRLITNLNQILNTFGYQQEQQKKSKASPDKKTRKLRCLKLRRKLHHDGQKQMTSKARRKMKKIQQKKGKIFSEEEKRKIVNEIGKSMAKSKLAKSYKIACSTLRKWELKYWNGDKGMRKSSRIEGSKQLRANVDGQK